VNVTETPSVVKDIVESAEERELWIVAREHERPPFFHEGKGGDTRLARAIRVCFDGKITPNSDGSYTVEGSAGRTYRVTNSCSCPQSQISKSKFCYHYVAVCLYIEWQKRLRPAQPLALGTLRPGTLPLPPVTVDERLAQAAADAMDHVYDALPVPQEDRMTEDAEHYIPEPDDAPVAILEGSGDDFPSMGSPATLNARPLLPSLDAHALEQSMQAWSAQRQVVKRFLQQELVEGTDYYTLRIKGRETKPALSKAGSEKFMALFQLHATFAQDTATWTMLGQPQGTLCYVCTLLTRSGEVVGEGRGARTVQQDNGDINKAVKMAQKSSCVDAILRTGALSDVFTQDEDSIPGATVEAPASPARPSPARPTAQDLRSRIWSRVQELAPEARTREAVEVFIQARTGMDLHPDLYQAIYTRLSEVAR
jgi:hypothetical protein